MIIEIPDDNSIIKWKAFGEEDWKYAEISDLIEAYEGRPKGEWISATLFGEHSLKCNQCGNVAFGVKYYNFCPNCGAKMI